MGNVRYEMIAELIFFFKKNRKEKSNIIITGNTKIEKYSTSSFENVANNMFKNNRGNAIEMATTIKFRL